MPSSVPVCSSVPVELGVGFTLPCNNNKNKNKTKVKSVQLGKPPTRPKVIRKVCVVAEVQEIILGGSIDYMVCKPTLVFSLSLDQAEE